DLLGRGEPELDQAVGNGREGEKRDLLHVAAAAERLNQRRIDLGEADTFQEPHEPPADERVGAAPARRLDVEVAVALVGCRRRVAEIAAVVNVLDDDHAPGRQDGEGPLQSLLRLGQMREDETNVYEVNLIHRHWPDIEDVDASKLDVG